MAWFKKTSSGADSNFPRPRGAENCLLNVTFVRTGELVGLTEDQLKTYISMLGGKMTGAVSGKTNYLIMGENCGATKAKAAQDKGVRVITEEEFYRLIETLTVKKLGLSAPPPRVTYEESLALFSGETQDGYELLDLDSSTQDAEAGSFASDSTPWIAKYKPVNCATFIGNKAALDELRIAMQSKSQYAVFVHGPSGVGKSLAVELVCRELGLEPYFITSAVSRTPRDLQSLLERLSGDNSILNFVKLSTQNKIITTEGRAIVIDEADAVDPQGLPFLNRYLDRIRSQGNTVPFVFIAGDYSQKLQTIQKKSVQIQFKRTPKNIIGKYLLDILDKEGIKIKNPSQLDILCDRANGDIRRIISGLQFLHSNILQFEKLQLPQEYRDLATAVFAFGRFRSNEPKAYQTLIDGFYQDQFLMPSLIQNYQVLSGFNQDYLAEAADTLSLMDTVSYQQFSRGDWRSSKAQGILGCYLGLYGMESKIKANGFAMPAFPSCISISVAQKGKRLLKQQFDKHDCQLLCDVLLRCLDQYEVDEDVLSQFRGMKNMSEAIDKLAEDYEFTIAKGQKRKTLNAALHDECEDLVRTDQAKRTRVKKEE